MIAEKWDDLHDLREVLDYAIAYLDLQTRIVFRCTQGNLCPGLDRRLAMATRTDEYFTCYTGAFGVGTMVQSLHSKSCPFLSSFL